MEIDPSVFPKLVFGAIGATLLGFVVRGFGRLVIPTGTATAVATPLLLGGVALMTVSFLLAVLVKLRVLSLADEGEATP